MKISTKIKLILFVPFYLQILFIQVYVVLLEIILLPLTMLSFDKWIKKYARRQLLATDQVINALMAGDEDETISSRAGRKWSGTWWSKLIDWIFRWQKDHCVNAIEEDEGKKDLLYPRV